MATESIHVSALIPASPQAVYDAWLSSEQHARMTGGDARVEPQVGGSHSAWGDYITGKTLELEHGARIVQSWRTLEFPSESGDSQITVTFEAEGDHTRVSIAHSDIPEGQGAKYQGGWVEHYFTPMTAYFGAVPEKPAARKAAAKKPSAGKAAKKPAGKKPAAKKTAKKAAAKKPAVKKAAKKPAARKAAKKPAPKKPAAGKGVAKKAAPKKPAARKGAAKKRAAKKPAPAPPAGT